MLETILILSVALLSIIIIYLLFFYNKKKVQLPISEEKQEKFFDLQSEESSEEIAAVLTVNYKEFSFTYPGTSEEKIVEIAEFIKTSLSIMSTSKYSDIIESRKSEIVNKLKKLTKISTFSEGQLKEAVETMEDYSKELKEK